MRVSLVIVLYSASARAAAIQNHDTHAELQRRQGGLVPVVAGVVGGLGGLVGSLGNALGLGGITGPLLDPLVGGLNSIAAGGKKAPAAAAAAAAAGLSHMMPQQQQQQAAPQQTQSPWQQSWGGQQASQPARADASVSIRGINVQCRTYPDDYVSDPNHAIRLSAPAKLDPVCWTPTTPGTLPASSSSWFSSSRDDGWLMTRANCYIKPSEVEEIRDYKGSLPRCQEVRHWVGTLSPQYSRKDCYYCPSTSNCGSEDLASAPPYVDILCSVQGEDAGGNSTWFKNRGKDCYFPGAIFDPNGFLGMAGSRC